MSVSENSEVAKNERSGLSSEFLVQMNEFRKGNKFCDVIIVIDDTKFPCHRVVLAAASKFFNKMFSGQYEESERKEIKMDSVSVNCFENVLEFTYCQQMDINPNNSFELLSASRFFDFNAMEEYCSMYVTEHIPGKFVFETCTFAELSNKKQLYDNVLRYIANDFANVRDQPAFLEISCEILKDIACHVELNCSHEVMLQSVIRWADGKNVKVDQLRNILAYIKTGDYVAKLICTGDVQRLLLSDVGDSNMNDMQERMVNSLRENAVSCIAQNLSKLYPSVLFMEMSYDLLEAIIAHPNLNCLVDDIIKCITTWKRNQFMNADKIQKLLSYVLKRGDVNQISAHWSKKLMSSADKQSRLIASPNHDVVELIYDEDNENWQRNELYSMRAKFQKSVVMNGRIFTLRVDGSGRVEFQVKTSDTGYRNLTVPPATPSDRCNMAAADDVIFLYTIKSWPTIGYNSKRCLGSNFYGTSGLVFAYVYGVNDWFLVDRYRSRVEFSYNMCLTADERFYLIGQENELFYYAIGGSWYSGSKTSYTHINGAACSQNGKLYVFGGQSNVLEAYDRKTDRWEVLQSAKYGRSCHSLVSYRNKLWAFGGTDNNLPIECYDPVTDVWMCMKSLPIPANACIVDAFVL